MTGFDAWMYQRMIEDSPEAVIVADADGRIQFWNAAASFIFGFTAEEALGETLDLIIPDPQRARHWAAYRQVMLSGETRYGRDLLAVPVMRKDGTRLSVEFHVVLLRNDDGRIAANRRVPRDVTARWQRERALIQRVRDLTSELAQSTSST